MRRSSRTTAALKNYKATLGARLRHLPDETPNDLVTKGSAGREVSPDVRAMIDRALADRQAQTRAG